MACGACGGRSGVKVEYTYTDRNGNVSTKKTETEAKAAVARTGGSYVVKK